MKNKGIITTIIIIIAVFVLINNADAQCAMCRKIAESDMSKGHPAPVSKNINTAILYLMAIPYVALGIYFRKPLYNLYKSFRAAKKPSSI